MTGDAIAPFAGRDRLCPRCTFTLVPRPNVAPGVEACPQCDGAFYDADACRAALGPRGDCAGWPVPGFVRAGGSPRIECPGGHGFLRRWRIAAGGASRAEVEVDACATCRSVWFDAGEVGRLQAALRDATFPGKPRADPGAPTLRAERWPDELIEIDTDVSFEDTPSARSYLFQFLTGLPLWAGQRAGRFPVVTAALILACAARFGADEAAGYRGEHPPYEAWAAVPAELRRGAHLGTVLTHMFVHAGWDHVLGNLWFLWTFGDHVERRIGRLRLVALYFASGVLGIAAETLVTARPEVPVVGASGAIAGLMGATLALTPRARIRTMVVFSRLEVPVALFLLLWVGFTAFEASLGSYSEVAWVAHLGGFAAGLAWALVFGRRFRDGAGPATAPAAGVRGP